MREEGEGGGKRKEGRGKREEKSEATGKDNMAKDKEAGRLGLGPAGASLLRFLTTPSTSSISSSTISEHVFSNFFIKINICISLPCWPFFFF
jgi:hypothetical protein